MGKLYKGLAVHRLSLVCVAVLAVAGCDESGALGPRAGSGGATSAAPVAAIASNQRTTERDVERPDVFSVTDRGLWDGRPSLGGVWVAHPDVPAPERVVIRNAENGREVIGALFRRERENPGPLLQVSSDAADALGILAGAPTQLSVVVLRREEVPVAPATSEENPVVAGLDAPVSVIAEPLAPVALPPEPAPEPAPEQAPVPVDLPVAVEAATAAVEQTTLAAADAARATAEVGSDVIDVSSVLSAAPANGPRAQIGVFSVKANADGAARRVNDAGIAAEVFPETMGGRTVWRVVAGPMVSEAGVAQLKALGFVDAFVIANPE